MHHRFMCRSQVLCLFLILFILVLLTGLLEGHPSKSREQHLLAHKWFQAKRSTPAGAKKVCGKQLRSLFSLVCHNRYHSKHTASIGERTHIPSYHPGKNRVYSGSSLWSLERLRNLRHLTPVDICRPIVTNRCTTRYGSWSRESGLY